MRENKSFFRKGTPDLPVSVYYFSVSYLDEKPQPLHRGTTFYLLLMQEGQVHYYTTSGMTVLHPGDICVVPPTLLRAIHTVTIPTRYIMFMIHPKLFAFPSTHFFSKEFFLPMQQGTLKMPQVLRQGMPGYAAVLEPLQRLDMQKEGTKQYSMELLTIAMEVCNALYPLCENTQEPDTQGLSVSEKCVYYIDQNAHKHITLQELAEHVHLHPNYLCQVFRVETGKSIFDQINWVRTHQASRLLRGTRLSISQVATQCGFQNVNYFSRTFKRYLGRTPTEYRKNDKKS